MTDYYHFLGGSYHLKLWFSGPGWEGCWAGMNVKSCKWELKKGVSLNTVEKSNEGTSLISLEPLLPSTAIVDNNWAAVTKVLNFSFAISLFSFVFLSGWYLFTLHYIKS